MDKHNSRIKISKDRKTICKFIIGDRVLVTFNKYGKHTFIGEIEEISENYHGLKGVWISILPVKEYKSDETAKQMIKDRIRCLVPLEDIMDLPN